MIRKTVAAILLAGMTLSACACTADAHGPKATTVSFAHEFVDPTAETTVLEIETGEFVETVTLKGSGEGETYQFSYDSDILQYTGQGGNFYLCGSTATECYLHIMVQKDDGTLYDTTKESVMGWILKEFKLNSGSRALSYATSEDNRIRRQTHQGPCRRGRQMALLGRAACQCDRQRIRDRNLIEDFI